MPVLTEVLCVVPEVGFIGVSNWSLDPAKMNRVVFLNRGDPSNDDLQLVGFLGFR